MRSYNVVAVVAIVLVLAGCGGGSGDSGTSNAYEGTALDIYVLSQLRPSDLVIFDGQENNFSADGASGANQDWQAGRGGLYIETQRRGLDKVEAGVAGGSSTMIDQGLKAIEWGLRSSVRGANNSYPDQRDTDTAPAHALHPKAEFLEAAAHAVVIIAQSAAISPEFKQRAAALVPLIHDVARYLIDSGDVASLFSSAENSNQLAFVAVSLFQTGRLANDTAMTASADALMQQILSMQRGDGVYPEKRGHDTGYQLVTVKQVTTYTNLVTDPAWRATLLAANTRAVNWFISRVRGDGSIDTTGNTRTTACGQRVPGTAPKGGAIDRATIRLYYHAFLAGSVSEIGPIADLIQQYGQDYDHINTCSGFEDES